MKKVRLIYLSILLFLMPTTAFTQYNVGNDDGFSVSCYEQVAFVVAIYSVGNDDGFSVSCVGSVGSEVPLPIELILFEAECEQNSVLLKWITASEINNDYFTLERSLDAMHFEPIGTVKGAGNSSTTLHYEFVDSEISPSGGGGALYYRLKQTDFDGQFEYSNIISASCNEELLKEINIYPNPITNELIIETTGNNEAVNFEIINSTGAVVYKSSFIQKTTIQTSKLATGHYIIKFESGNIFEFKKIIKQ